MNDKLDLVPQVRLTISSAESLDHGVFGKGANVLLEGVRQHGSLNKAAKDLGMAYSKAWTLMRDTESTLGVQLIDRDGARGSSLTPTGNKLLGVYEQLDAEIKDFAKKRLEELLQD